jgi:type II restriction enzyme
MENILQNAIQSAQRAEIAFSKFITANDTGSTGAHQYGYHIHKQAWPLMFDKPGEKGTNSENFITIRWQKDFETSSRFIYYGVGTRDEYRLTRFGKGFPYLSDDNIGDLLILCKISASYYEAFVIQGDEDIEQFFAALNITVNQTNQIIPRQTILPSEDRMNVCFKDFLKRLSTDFPSTFDLSEKARTCYNKSYDITLLLIQEDPDKRLIDWLDAEYQLFKIIENDRYDSRIKTPFNSVGELVETANTILNRRKSRAGKSLEHHLAEIFTLFKISFESQVITEDNKRPDFLFPGGEAYANSGYDESKLVMLASKTTCKDRWRQVLNEADRIKTKHLFTLQQGVSTNQLKEMVKYNVQLVVPRSYLSSYPKEYRSKIMILEQFLTFTRSTQL